MDPIPKSPFTGLARISSRCLKRPRLTLALGVAIAAASVTLTFNRLEFQTSRQDLINPRSEFHERWLSYVDEFGAQSDIVVVVESNDKSAVKDAIDEIGTQLRRYPDLFCDVLERFDAERLLSKGLYYVPHRELEQLESFVARAMGRLNDPRVRLDDLLAVGQPPSLNRIALADLTVHAPDTSASELASSIWINDLRRQFPSYSLAQQGRLGIVLTRLVESPSGFVPDAEPFQVLGRIRSQLERDDPRLLIGLTGLPILEHDEMQTSQQDMTWASLLSVVAVGSLVWAGFGGWKYPLLGMASLLLGIAWTWGYLTLAVGHLNILSISFGVILIGLGIDFAIHFIARYIHIRTQGQTTDSALVQTMQQAGPPILAGGITTAAAFFATSVTEFKGVAELGLISGGGVLLCVASTLLMLPSGIQCLDARSNRRARNRLPALETWATPFWNRPWHTIITLTGCTLFLATGVNRLQYDHNLLNLQAQGLPSVTWERKLLQHADRNSWFAVSVADSLDQVRRRKQEFQKLPSVQRVDELASLLPVVPPRTQEIIRRIHRRLARLPTTEPVLEPITPVVTQANQRATASEQSWFSNSMTTFDTETTFVNRNAKRTLAAAAIWRSLRHIEQMSGPQPPQLTDIPQSVRRRFVGRSGTHVLRVFPREDIWQTEPLERFVRQLEQVDAQVTGDPVETFYASRQMKDSYLRAAWLAALAVGAILVLDLRRVSDVLMALLPTGLGLLQLFGLMGLLGIPLNPANIIVLPLIIGIGIDDGIHVIHDHRRNESKGRLSRATVTGIVLTSLTSMIGFGSLMLARHEGLRSLGRVVTLGIACCLVTSVVLLPCLLGVLHRRKPTPLPMEARSSPPR